MRYRLCVRAFNEYMAILGWECPGKSGTPRTRTSAHARKPLRASRSALPLSRHPRPGDRGRKGI